MVGTFLSQEYLLSLSSEKNYLYRYSRTPLIHHLWDWGYGWNAEKVGLSENTEKYEFTKGM